MSELISKNRQYGHIRRNLLANVSAIALLGYIWTTSGALAASQDEERPTVWIELGGQFERTDSQQSILAPPFVEQAPSALRDLMTDAQRPSPYALGEEAKISFEPEGTDWVLSASVRYGRANSARHPDHQGPKIRELHLTVSGHKFLDYSPSLVTFADGQTSARSTHLVADFKAGKDVGLGIFGSHAESVFSAGVRFAQFTSRNDVTLHARPDMDLTTKYSPGRYKIYHLVTHSFAAFLHAERNTQAIGPALSWDASAVVAGTDNGTDLTFDWGVNASVLFGRQRAKTHHQSSGYYRTGFFATLIASHFSNDGPNRTRSRTVTIPNIGGFAGLSLKFPNAKVSLGYRGDFFFGATDGGIDAHQSTDQKFYGPFASVSIGLGG